MLDAKLEKAINTQINHEMNASYIYLAMAGRLDRMNLDGFSTWMEAQSREEQDHAQRLYRYLLDRGGKLELQAIAKPPTDYDSVRDVFEKSLALEHRNTQAINELYMLAKDLNDFATLSHLQWFLDEQVEEEKTVEDVLGRLNLIADDKSALLILDDQMARRGAATDAVSGAE